MPCSVSSRSRPARRLQSAPNPADIGSIDRDHPFLQPATFLRVIPTMAVVGVAWALAWSTNGSADAGDWLPYALVVAVVLAVTLVAGIALVPERVPLLAAALLAAFGLWTALSIAWSPLPSLARNDALLCLLYAGAFLTPLLTLRTRPTGCSPRRSPRSRSGFSPSSRCSRCAAPRFRATCYTEGRLDFPVSYWNGAAALFLIGTWPALALSADRRLGVALRARSLAGATAMVTCWLQTGSKGGAVALAASGIVLFVFARARLRVLVPTAIVAILAAAGVGALTAPYRASAAGLLDTIHHAGSVSLVLTGIALVLGVGYALVDRRLTLSQWVAPLLGGPSPRSSPSSPSWS